MIGRRPITAALLACAWLPLSAPASRGEDPFESARQAFRQAYAEVDQPSESRRPDSEELRTYPLYPYLQPARIRRALAAVKGERGTVDERAATFITYYEREPVGRSLHRVWLASLAERRQWAPFLEHYREALADDALECQSYAARIGAFRILDFYPGAGRPVAATMRHFE